VELPEIKKTKKIHPIRIQIKKFKKSRKLPQILENYCIASEAEFLGFDAYSRNLNEAQI
jgi:hypothetical protein